MKPHTILRTTVLRTRTPHHASDDKVGNRLPGEPQLAEDIDGAARHTIVTTAFLLTALLLTAFLCLFPFIIVLIS